MENIFYIDAEPTLEEMEELEEMETEETEEYYSQDSMKMYMNEIAKIPLLTAEEEKQLAQLIAENGPDAMAAKDRMLTANLRLVAFRAKRYLNRGVDFDDLNTMGYEGLVKAVEKFDHTRGYRFSTYAIWWIDQAIARGIACEADTVRVPVHMQEVARKVRRAVEILKQEKMQEPTMEEVAEYTNLPLDKVKAAYEAGFCVVSFDYQITDDGDVTMEDLLADENAVDPCQAVLQSDLQKAVKNVLAQLPEKEATVLRLRYGIGCPRPMTLEEVASLPGFGVTRERVRQIEEKAIRTIRRTHSLKSQLEDYALAG
jgi:RNA polymerase primary sigma factor